ncbi:MAG: TonB-dependent receptor [Agriterribacter sp.]
MKKLPGILLFSLCVIKVTYGQNNGAVYGTVKTSDGKAASQVTIQLSGKNAPVMTDDYGNYNIRNIIPGNYVLTATLVGHEAFNENIIIEANKSIALHFQLSESKQQLSEVVVVANKKTYVVSNTSASLRLNTPLIETPQNISVATQQTIKDFGITGTSQMARLTSGITKGWGNENDFSFIIRGTYAWASLFKNGVGGVYWNQQSDGFMIDRVEFVKGPAGFMIGNSEPGGLVNEVFKQADGVKTQQIMLGYGSYNLFRAGIDFGDKFSSKSKFSYRVILGGQTTRSFYDFYKSNRMYGVASLRYTYKDNSYVQVMANRMEGFAKADNSNNITLDGKNFIFPKNFNSIDPNAINGTETDDTYFRINNQHKFKNGWTFKAQFALVSGIWKGDGMYVSKFSSKFDTLYRDVWTGSWPTGLMAAQAFIDGKFTTGKHIEHSVLSGLDFGDSWYKGEWSAAYDSTWGSNFPLLVAKPTYNLNRDWVKDTTSYPGYKYGTLWMAWYGQDHIKIYNKFIITLAGRFSLTKTVATWDTAQVYDKKFTPRMGLTYLILKNMSVYTLYDQTFLPQTGRKEDNTRARPLTGSNIEVGYKAEIKSRLAVNASLFHTVKNDVLVQNPATQLYVQRGQITINGFEFGVIGNLNKNIMVNFNYTFTDAKITKDPNPEMIGFPNYGVAKHVTNAMIRYKFTQRKLKGFSAGLGMQLTDDVSVVWAGWTDPKDKKKTIPAYTLWDANAGYDWKKISLQINVFNLTNQQVLTSGWWVSDDGPDGRGYYSGSISTPINFRVAFFYKLR